MPWKWLDLTQDSSTFPKNWLESTHDSVASENTDSNQFMPQAGNHSIRINSESTVLPKSGIASVTSITWQALASPPGRQRRWAVLLTVAASVVFHYDSTMFQCCFVWMQCWKSSSIGKKFCGYYFLLAWDGFLSLTKNSLFGKEVLILKQQQRYRRNFNSLPVFIQTLVSSFCSTVFLSDGQPSVSWVF